MSSVRSDALVRDLMTRDLVTCSRDADLASVASTMAQRRVHAVFVLGDEGRPEGVVSDFDMLAGEWLGDDKEGLSTMKSVTAGELMSSPIETIDADATLAAAAARLRELRLGRLLVTDDQGAAVGVITGADLLALYESPQSATTAKDLMRAPITCDIDLSIRDAVDLIITEEVHRVVVTDPSSGDAAPVGILSTSDVIREMTQEGSVWQTD